MDNMFCAFVHTNIYRLDPSIGPINLMNTVMVLGQHPARGSENSGPRFLVQNQQVSYISRETYVIIDLYA